MSTGQGDQRPSQRHSVIIPTTNEQENLPLISAACTDAPAYMS